MKVLAAVLLFFPVLTFSQPAGRIDNLINQNKSTPIIKGGSPAVPLSAEICGNGIDDDKNGLTDDNDFGCYFSSSRTDCAANKIVWVNSPYALLWVNLETGVERLVGSMPAMDDITWGSDGKLYGIDHFQFGICEINPNTAAITPLMKIAGYYASNSMTADASGNLYLSASSQSGARDVIKLNIATGNVSVIASLSPYDLVSSGDITFLNGYLYLTCDGNKLAKINTKTGGIEVFNIKGLSYDANFGLLTLGDGYLYLGRRNQLIKLDPATMETSEFYTFKDRDLAIWGATNYTDQCNAPGCKAKITIGISSAAPYCSSPGVLLQVKGTGIKGDYGYRWTKPDGSTGTGETLTATRPGKYFVYYHTIPDTCGQTDSVFLNILTSPVIKLSGNTMLCKDSSLNIGLVNPESQTAYSWQDGTVSPSYKVTRPGTYVVTASNVCGSIKDSITVQEIEKPKVFIGQDTSVCPGTQFLLYNQYGTPAWNTNKWWNLSASDSVKIRDKGLYWLEASNICGTSRDSVLVSHTDSCTCFPFYPEADLGPDHRICFYDSLVLKNEKHRSGFHYQWQNGSGGPTFVAKAPGIYWVDVSTYCATKRDSIIITQKDEGCNRAVYVPNAFTPNNDRKNDVLKPIITGSRLTAYRFVIYNRWGEKVFETTNTADGWDGQVRGQKQNNGVFAWTCSYRFENMEPQAQSGTVTIIR